MSNSVKMTAMVPGGKNKAQINLKNGESYNLVVTAVNSAGSVTKHIELTWSQ